MKQYQKNTIDTSIEIKKQQTNNNNNKKHTPCVPHQLLVVKVGKERKMFLSTQIINYTNSSYYWLLDR